MEYKTMKIPKYHKKYVCDACGTPCVIIVSNTWDSLPCPGRCVYEDDEDITPNWREEDSNEYEKDDEWRQPYPNDDEYMSKLTDEEKNEIIRNHFDCKMKGGCPCYLDKDYKCEEWQAYCKLTGSDGSDFEFDDCWFRSNEHRCLTNYILWKMKK